VPIYQLTDELLFPHPSLSDPIGIVAIGGDLSPQRLLLAYAHGIFPWYQEPSPILWWSPDPRLVLFPGEIKISRSLERVIKKQLFTVTIDRAFGEVIRACAQTRDETWITTDMIEAYEALHKLGYAHSFESWHEGRLVGGLYGVALGRAFFGESMFSIKSDASKVALVRLAQHLARLGFDFIDCQTTTQHLKRFGAKEIPRKEFLERLSKALSSELRQDM
jgi:leucyl/phenylalanyl-tRNA--protein transferase